MFTELGKILVGNLDVEGTISIEYRLKNRQPSFLEANKTSRKSKMLLSVLLTCLRSGGSTINHHTINHRDIFCQAEPSASIMYAFCRVKPRKGLTMLAIKTFTWGRDYNLPWQSVGEDVLLLGRCLTAATVRRLWMLMWQ